jgi:hypothetical protein
MPSKLTTDLARAWAGDLDGLIAQYVEDCTFEDKAFGIVHHGHAGLREVFAFTFTMMPDFRVTYGHEVIGADCGAAEWIFTGSFHGDYEGKVHRGTPVQISGVSFMTFRAGKIVTNCDYWNVKTIEQQLAAG